MRMAKRKKVTERSSSSSASQLHETTVTRRYEKRATGAKVGRGLPLAGAVEALVTLFFFGAWIDFRSTEGDTRRKSDISMQVP